MYTIESNIAYIYRNTSKKSQGYINTVSQGTRSLRMMTTRRKVCQNTSFEVLFEVLGATELRVKHNPGFEETLKNTTVVHKYPWSRMQNGIKHAYYVR